MTDAEQLLLLIILWALAFTLFVLGTKRRREEESGDELQPGAKLGAGGPDELDLADRRAVREAALRHAGAETEDRDADERASDLRVAALIAAIQDDPDSLPLRDRLIEEYQARGERHAAVQQLLLAADLLERDSEREQANDRLRQVLDLEPANEHAQRRLGLRDGGEGATAG